MKKLLKIEGHDPIEVEASRDSIAYPGWIWVEIPGLRHAVLVYEADVDDIAPAWLPPPTCYWPDWAQWIAADENGDAWLFEAEPRQMTVEWWPKGDRDRVIQIGVTTRLSDWRQSLMSRAEVDAAWKEKEK